MAGAREPITACAANFLIVRLHVLREDTVMTEREQGEHNNEGTGTKVCDDSDQPTLARIPLMPTDLGSSIVDDFPEKGVSRYKTRIRVL